MKKLTFQHRSHHGGLTIAAISSIFRRCGTAGSLFGVASVLILLIFYLGQGRDGNNNNHHVGSSIEAQAQHTIGPNNTVQNSIVSLRPNRITLGGRQVLYQFPPNSKSSCDDHLKGVLFLYHGCTRTAMSFFYSPQGRDMMRTALLAGLAVVAFEKEGSCWSSSVDLDVSINIGKEWMDKYLVDHCGEDCASVNNSKMPIFGFGASSGGSFVAEVAEATKKQKKEVGNMGFQFAAINVQIMTPHVAIQTPTAFTVMNRDEFTMQGVEHTVRELKRANVPTLLLKTQPKKITVEYLLDRFQDDETFTKDIAEGVVNDLQQMGAIAKDGELMQNPRSIDLDPLIAKYPKPTAGEGAYGVSSELWEMMTPSEREDASQLWLVEELNVAFDQHEITNEKFGDVIEFFFSQLQ